MVKLAAVLPFVALITSAAATCDKLRVKLLTHEAEECGGHSIAKKEATLKQGKCMDLTAFHSYKATVYEGHKGGRKSPIQHRNCQTFVYDREGCHGHNMTSGDLNTYDGACANAHFTDAAYSRPARSIIFYCFKKDANKNHDPPSLPVAPAPIVVTVHDSTTEYVTTESPSSTPYVDMVVEDVKSASTTPVVATIKTTTTVLNPPVATVEGTTTVWYAPDATTSTMSADTASSANENEALMSNATTNTTLTTTTSMAAGEKRMRARAVSETQDCYALVDGEWKVIQCEADDAQTESDKVKRSANQPSSTGLGMQVRNYPTKSFAVTALHCSTLNGEAWSHVDCLSTPFSDPNAAATPANLAMTTTVTEVVVTAVPSPKQKPAVVPKRRQPRNPFFGLEKIGCIGDCFMYDQDHWTVTDCDEMDESKVRTLHGAIREDEKAQKSSSKAAKATSRV